MNTIKKYLAVTLFLAATFGFAVNTYSQSVEESAADNLPLPSTLIAKHVEALGGEQALRSQTARTVNGKLIIKAYGIEGELQMFAAAPDKIATTVELGQFGSSRSGYNGTIGWSMDPMSGNRILQGEALNGMIRNANFHGNDMNLGNNAIKQETVEMVTFNDGDQYKVLLVDADGEETYLYFSKETGLLSGLDRMESGMMGRTPTEIRLGNYIESGGIKTAHRIVSSQNGGETIIEIDSVSYDGLPENAFELPAEIQALVNK